MLPSRPQRSKWPENELPSPKLMLPEVTESLEWSDHFAHDDRAVSHDHVVKPSSHARRARLPRVHEGDDVTIGIRDLWGNEVSMCHSCSPWNYTHVSIVPSLTTIQIRHYRLLAVRKSCYWVQVGVLEVFVNDIRIVVIEGVVVHDGVVIVAFASRNPILRELVAVEAVFLSDVFVFAELAFGTI
jgi:hypothetical protein